MSATTVASQHPQQDVLRFLTDPLVPFTNDTWPAGRMVKLRQKICGGFPLRGWRGLRGDPLTPIPPARKQGWHIIAADRRSIPSPARFLHSSEQRDPVDRTTWAVTVNVQKG